MKHVPVILLALACTGAMSSLAGATEFKVAQKGQQFSPQTLKIKAGDEVVFVNDDTGTHNVFSRERHEQLRSQGAAAGCQHQGRLSEGRQGRCPLCHPSVDADDDRGRVTEPPARTAQGWRATVTCACSDAPSRCVPASGTRPER